MPKALRFAPCALGPAIDGRPGAARPGAQYTCGIQRGMPRERRLMRFPGSLCGAWFEHRIGVFVVFKRIDDSSRRSKSLPGISLLTMSELLTTDLNARAIVRL